MLAHWLLTSTFYGTWLPGAAGGFVGSVRDRRPDDPDVAARIEHAAPGSPVDADLPGLWRASRDRLKGEPVSLTMEQAVALLEQFRETAAVRGWTLLAVAIMPDHVHLVVAAPPECDPGRMLGDFKAYGSRILNECFGRPTSGTWWTARGSTRKKDGPEAIAEAIDYVLYRQTDPLVTWSPETGVRRFYRPGRDEPGEPPALAGGVVSPAPPANAGGSPGGLPNNSTPPTGVGGSPETHNGEPPALAGGVSP